MTDEEYMREIENGAMRSKHREDYLLAHPWVRRWQTFQWAVIQRLPGPIRLWIQGYRKADH